MQPSGPWQLRGGRCRAPGLAHMPGGCLWRTRRWTTTRRAARQRYGLGDTRVRGPGRRQRVTSGRRRSGARPCWQPWRVVGLAEHTGPGTICLADATPAATWPSRSN